MIEDNLIVIALHQNYWIERIRKYVMQIGRHSLLFGRPNQRLGAHRTKYTARFPDFCPVPAICRHGNHRSEEHTSELQSLMRTSYAVFCLKKKNNKTQHKLTKQ